MPVYQYRVRDASGKILSSQIEADTLAQVRDALRSKGLFIVDIKPPKTGLQADISVPFLDNQPPGLKVVAVFSRQLATMINSGVPLVQSLNIMTRQTEHKGFAKILKNMRSEVESGTPFSDSIAKYPKVFSRLYLNLVRAGEVSGSLDAILDRISAFLEKDLALRGKIKSALTYPVIVLVFAILITYFLLTTIVPQFAGILFSLNAPLPLITRVLIAVSGFLQHQWYILLGIIVLLVVGYRYAYSTKKGRHTIDDIKLKLPLLGPLIRKSAIASFSRTLSLLIASGVNIVEALDITRGTANNAIVEDTLENARNVVMVGEQMSGSLATSKIFPPMVVSMVAIGEETGALDTMLSKVADFYDREVDEAVDSLTAAIEPIMIVVLGAIVGVIVAGMFLPMFSIIGQLSKS